MGSQPCVLARRTLVLWFGIGLLAVPRVLVFYDKHEQRPNLVAHYAVANVTQRRASDHGLDATEDRNWPNSEVPKGSEFIWLAGWTGTVRPRLAGNRRNGRSWHL